MSLQWGKVLWVSCKCSLQLSAAVRPRRIQEKRSWGQAALCRERWRRERKCERAWVLPFWSEVGLWSWSIVAQAEFASRCKDWGTMWNWVWFRVHFEIHNDRLNLLVPARGALLYTVSLRIRDSLSTLFCPYLRVQFADHQQLHISLSARPVCHCIGLLAL